MTEDDTYEALRRISFNELLLIPNIGKYRPLSERHGIAMYWRLKVKRIDFQNWLEGFLALHNVVGWTVAEVHARLIVQIKVWEEGIQSD